VPPDHLLLTYAQDSFDVFVTIDRKLEYQHNLRRFGLAFIIIRVPNNQIESYRPVLPALLEAVAGIAIGDIAHVGH